MPPKQIPKGSVLEKCDYFGIREGRKVWRSHDGERFYTWDSLHGEIEVFNKRGLHLGVVDPITGVAIKPAVKGRNINV